MPEIKQFKAESKRLLDLMINSIYTHKEIFLRELISNASDAIDKLYFKSLTDDRVGLDRSDFCISVSVDKDDKKLIISDNGIGMTAEELENNLGVIARSDSLDFKKEIEENPDINIIGQFGVGFYSAFMVSKEITVISKAYGADKAYRWHSEGADGYTVEECEKASAGTDIILSLKEDAEDEKYSDFLSQWKIKSLVKKYSDYIRYPIKMDVEHEKLIEGTGDGEKDPEYEKYTENETLNSMIPIWRKNKSELSDEDYFNFYKDKFYDYSDPAKYIHVKTEGAATYDGLLYIPAKAPYDFYSKEFEKGVQLYSSGVMIMDKCADLLPDHFSFVKGLVDSQDLSLNISRELLQHDRQLKLIAKSLEKTVKNELKKMLSNEREKYEDFWKSFGLQIKFGVYNGYGVNKDLLKDILIFTSSFTYGDEEAKEGGYKNKYVSLDEYVGRMKEGQQFIYYAAGETAEKINSLPQTEMIRDKGFEILYLTDNVDEFAVQVLMEYEGKKFQSVSAANLDIDSPEQKEEVKKLSEDNKDLFEAIKSALDGKVKAARVSERLKTHPVCLVNDGLVSLEMEKTLNNLPNNADSVKAELALEINPAHPIFEALKKLYASDKNKLADYSKILYSQALLIEGMPVDDPVEYSKLICSLMV